MGDAIGAAFSRLPPAWRERIKGLLRGGGHGSSWTDDLKARRSAVGKKRLDHSAEELVRRYGDNFPRVAGKACLDFGSGYVPAEAFLFDILGASRVVATDYNRIAKFPSLWRAFSASDPQRLSAACMALGGGAEAQARLESLRRTSPQQGVAYLENKIAYVAPHDYSARGLDQSFDYIHSLSVMEHIPAGLLPSILANLAGDIAPGGMMGHVIDLCDHRDLEGAPLAFLESDSDYDVARDTDPRGNRLRKSDWLKLFADLPGVETTCLWQEDVAPEKIPTGLASSFAAHQPDDLRVGRILLTTRRA